MIIAVYTNTDKKSPRHTHSFVRVVEDTNNTIYHVSGLAVGTPSGGVKELALDIKQSGGKYDLVTSYVVDRDDAQYLAEQLRKSFGLQCYNKRKISVKKSKTIAGQI